MDDPENQNNLEAIRTFATDLEAEAERGYSALKADTLEVLAEKMGADPDAIRHTVERYNRFCAEKRDEDLLKDPQFLRPMAMQPPYYAVLVYRMRTVTIGGVTCDCEMRVMREDGEAIPGAYVAGDLSSGGGGLMTGLSWAFNSGYLCGEHAAAYSLQGE